MWAIDDSSDEHGDPPLAEAEPETERRPDAEPQPKAVPRPKGRPKGTLRRLDVVLKARSAKRPSLGPTPTPPTPAIGSIGIGGVIVAASPPTDEKQAETVSKYRVFLSQVQGKRLLNISALADRMQSRHQRVTEIYAALSAAAFQAEHSGFSNLLAVLHGMTSNKRITPVCFLFWRRYDETPIKLALRWGSAKELQELETSAKLMLVEAGWGMFISANKSDGANLIEK